MISAVIFDMDGVIIDSEPVHARMEQELMDDLGLEISDEEYARYVGRSDLWHRIKEEYDMDFEVEELRQRKESRYISYLKESFNEGPVEGVIDLIGRLDAGGMTLVLASSSSMKNIELVLEKFGLSDRFSFKISGADLETSKPHPEIFLKAAQMADVKPAECLVIEDSENGVRAAKAAGMRCIGYKNPNSGSQDLGAADWIIGHFDEFDLERYHG